MAGKGQVGDGETCESNPAAAAVVASMSEGSNESFDCTDTDDVNLNKCCLAESRCSIITVGDVTTCRQAADTVDITSAGETESLLCHNESTADDSMPTESLLRHNESTSDDSVPTESLLRHNESTADDSMLTESLLCHNESTADDSVLTESLLRHNESTADDSVEHNKSVESIDDSSSRLEELSQVNEIQSDHAATHEDDGWIYVLGHDQLKKRARVM